MVARDRIGAFPGRTSKRAGRAAALGSRDGQHALAVWDSVRQEIAGRASGIERGVGGRDGLAGAVDVEALVLLGRHVAGCRRPDCQGWLSWAVGRSGSLRDVFAALGGSWGTVPPGYGAAVRRLAALRASQSPRVGLTDRV